MFEIRVLGGSNFGFWRRSWSSVQIVRDLVLSNETLKIKWLVPKQGFYNIDFFGLKESQYSAKLT